MLTAITALFASSTARNALLTGVAAAALLGTGLYARHEHSLAAGFRVQVASSQAQVAEVTADAALNQAALEASAAASVARETEISNIRNQIHDAPKSTNCAGSAAVRALLDGLRGADGSGPTVTGAGKSARVRATANDTSSGRR